MHIVVGVKTKFLSNFAFLTRWRSYFLTGCCNICTHFSEYQLDLVDRPFVICRPYLIKISLIFIFVINAAEHKSTLKKLKIYAELLIVMQQ